MPWLCFDGEGADIAVALEIGGIEGKDALDGIHAHYGYEPGVINRDALDAMVLYDLFPNGVNRWDVRQQN
jgi:hypothetical protein